MHYTNKKVSKRRKIYIYTIASISIGILTFFFLSSSLYITTLVVYPESYQKEVEALVHETYTDKLFYILPSQHIAFVQKNAITQKIEQHFSEIRDVTITRKNINTLSFSLERRIPLFRKENNIAVDTYGIVYTEKNIDDTYIDTLPLLTTSIILPQKEILQSIADFSSKISIRIDTVSHIDINQDNDVYYYFAHKKCIIKTSLSKDTNATWSTLISALDNETLKSALQKDKNDVEYIDIRFGNKVFYSFTQEIEKATSTESKANTTHI